MKEPIKVYQKGLAQSDAKKRRISVNTNRRLSNELGRFTRTSTSLCNLLSQLTHKERSLSQPRSRSVTSLHRAASPKKETTTTTKESRSKKLKPQPSASLASFLNKKFDLESTSKKKDQKSSVKKKASPSKEKKT